MDDRHSETLMEKIAAFIVDKRKAFYLVFAIAVVFCINCIPKVRVNNDLSVYLPENSETRRGVAIMAEEFQSYASAQVMISNITYKDAESFAAEFAKLDGVLTVSFDDSENSYRNSSALLMVSFAGVTTDPEVEAAMATIRERLEGYDVYYNTEVGYDVNATLASEMALIMLIAVVVVVAVLLTTSKSYMELVVFVIVFVVAAILNMGTNYLLKEISFVTNSIAVILQLALAVDYAIILCHRYMEERDTLPAREADIKALSKAIIEISSSSLTTVSGLVALTTMQFKIGADIGIVLIKSIICSLTTVFLLMPGLLMMFNRSIERTRHRNFIPDISAWGRFVIKIRYFVLPVFLIVFVASIFFSSKCDYAFSYSDLSTRKESEATQAQNKIKNNFGTKNMIAILVPKGDYESEKKVISKISDFPEIVGALGLASVKIDGDRVLTDKYTPRQFSELAEVDIELARLLYQAYGLSKEEYGAIFQNVDDYSVPLINVFRFLLEQREKGVINLSAEQNELIDALNDTLEDALNQLEGENYSRIVFTADVPDEGEKTEALLENMRAVAQQYYSEDEVVLVSNATLALDLNRSFTKDNLRIGLLTALFVMVILLFTFKSVGLPFLLILTIQGSIFINFSFPYLTGTRLYFLGYLIVSAIQMGATIDYAILLTNRYQTLKLETDRKSAIIEAVNQSFPTVFTSGTIMTVAGFLVGFVSSEPTVSTMGMVLGRGTLTSMILVMAVLPQILFVCDSIIEKTALTLTLGHFERVHTDELRMDGKIRGMVTGYVDGEFKGLIKGSINASLESGNAAEFSIDEIIREEHEKDDENS